MIDLLINNPLMLLYLIPIVLFSLSAHEVAHGYVAYLCGDGTAKMHGRLTLNPIKHLDPIGALMMLLFGFGYAKPVPVVIRNFRKPRRDIALVSLAGPATNFLLAALSVIILFIIILFASGADSRLMKEYINYHNNPFALYLYGDARETAKTIAGWGFSSFNSGTITALLGFFSMNAIINAGLCVFNLIPLPPLDGSKILASLLPNHMAARYLRLEYYSRFILLGILFFSRYFDNYINLFYPVELLRNAILWLFQSLMLIFF